MTSAATAVVLFNLGGPDDLASVEPFLVNLFSDRDIIRLPLGRALQPVVARLIAKMRGPSVRRNYASIGGGSPQLRITTAQAAALEARLQTGGDYRVFVAMRYSRPTCEDAIEAIAAAGIRRIVLDAARELGVAIGWLIGVLNVRHVLLVGPVAEFGDDWLAEVRRHARSSVLALLARDTQIEFGHVHDDVVVLGASALLMEQQLGLGLAR